MIFSLTDETYALLCGTKIPPEVDTRKAMLFMAALNQSYWVFGCTFGDLFGSLVKFDTTGVDFAMTALFIVIFIDQWQDAKTHLPVYIGVACGIISLLLIGPKNFIIPALAAAIGLLIVFKKPIEKSDPMLESENVTRADDEEREDEACCKGNLRRFQGRLFEAYYRAYQDNARQRENMFQRR